MREKGREGTRISGIRVERKTRLSGIRVDRKQD
jgi:hypothetical protein